MADAGARGDGGGARGDHGGARPWAAAIERFDAASAWHRLAALPLRIEDAWLEPLALDTASGWTRRSTVVHLRGAGVQGRGEDVTYAGDEQQAFQALAFEDTLLGAGALGGAGADYDGTLGAWCEVIASLDLFESVPAQAVSRAYRQWALESAALDLALRQADAVLADLLGRAARPTRFVVSPTLGTPPEVARLHTMLQQLPGLRFKLDWNPDWDAALLADLATTARVDVVDFKGQYRGAFEGPRADAEAYRAVAEALPAAWLEDPAWETATATALAPHQARVTWDVPLHAPGDLDALPCAPTCVNLKPSRCGALRTVLAVYGACSAQGLRAYGGGQFELGVGRTQAQHLAALFHADSPNDLAPVAFHGGAPPADVPQAQIPAPPDLPGFGLAG